MKKLQVPLVVLLLFAVVYGMNTISDMKQKQAKEMAKTVEEQKKAAEAAAAAKNPPPKEHGGAPAFKLPDNTGPATAPIKVEVFINNANSCHEGTVVPMKELHKVYGDLVRTEWYSTNDPKVSARTDKLKIGCEAGLVLNGKVEAQVDRNGGKVLVDFRGKAGDKFKLEDLYSAINHELKAAGKTPPAQALQNAKAISAPGH